MIKTSEELLQQTLTQQTHEGPRLTAHQGKHNHYSSTVDPQDRRKWSQAASSMGKHREEQKRGNGQTEVYTLGSSRQGHLVTLSMDWVYLVQHAYPQVLPILEVVFMITYLSRPTSWAFRTRKYRTWHVLKSEVFEQHVSSSSGVFLILAV